MPRHKRQDGKGEHSATLTPEQVIAIRKAKTDQHGYCKRLAGIYGISDRHVRRIWNRTKWSWLNEKNI